MSERLSEPDIAWYRLQPREIAVLLVLGLLFVVMASWAMLHDSAVIDPKVKAHELPAAKVNVNSASAAELTALPGIGERKAQRIVEARGQQPIRNLDELASAAGGIPRKDLDRMTNYVVFD
ncbi:MAG: helix-hairpin-helix domain-containing protein [Planctomycetes bacterium]|nr:helix-hairpin-helix domain-containing protein [Planctomycetota bacterium]